MPLLTMLAAIALSLAAGNPDAAWHQEVTRAAQRNFPEFLELLAHDNVASSPANIRLNAELVSRLFEKRGFTTRLLDNPAGRPAVFAEYPHASGKGTLLFYIHMDGQPVIPAEWAQKDPFQPVVKEHDAKGEWHEVARERLE